MPQWISRNDQQVPEKIPDFNSGGNYSREVKEFYARDVAWKFWDRSSVQLDKRFAVRPGLRKATLCGTGLGFYEIFANGVEIDAEHVLKPVKTTYQDRAAVKTRDITAFLKEGENDFMCEVAHGWFSPPPKYRDWHSQWQGIPCAYWRLTLEYNDGTRDEIDTDDSWKWRRGKVWDSDIYDGEKADMRLQDEPWKPVQILPPPVKTLFEQTAPDNAVKRVLRPIAPPRLAEERERTMWEVPGYTFPESPFGTYVYDFGENITGRVRIKSGDSGLHVIVRYAEEVVDSPFRLDTQSLWGAAALDEIYIPAKSEYAPRFTYHGFRYCSVELRDGPDMPVEVTAEFIYADVKKKPDPKTDDPFLRKLHEAVVRTQACCLQMGVPIDCPQRAERLGWLGDAHVTAREAMDNFELDAFYDAWLDGIAAQQSPSGDIPHVSPRAGVQGDVCWSSGYTFMVWEHYLHYRRVEVLEKNYPHMVRYAEYLSNNLLEDGTLSPSRYGDWHMLAQNRNDPRWKGGMPFLTSTAYYHRMLTILADSAAAIGRSGESLRWHEAAMSVRVAAEKKWYDRANGSWGTGIEGVGANSLALYCGLVLSSDVARVQAALVRELEAAGWHITAGILGTQALFAVSDTPELRKAVLKCLDNDSPPSYRSMLCRKTNLCEQWDAVEGSFNHIMFGSVDTFLRSL